jgi:hypothetical protein
MRMTTVVTGSSSLIVRPESGAQHNCAILAGDLPFHTIKESFEGT